MIVAWSETYLRTSLTTAFNGVRASPPSISVYLVEPPPIVERPVQAAPPPAAAPRATQPMTSTVNRTDREREGATAIATTSNPSWQANLPEVMLCRVLDSRLLFSRLGLDPDRRSWCQYATRCSCSATVQWCLQRRYAGETTSCPLTRGFNDRESFANNRSSGIIGRFSSIGRKCAERRIGVARLGRDVRTRTETSPGATRQSRSRLSRSETSHAEYQALSRWWSINVDVLFIFPCTELSLLTR